MTAENKEIVVTCPVCRSSLSGELINCDKCSTPHHKECWDYIGHCAIFGCYQDPKALARKTNDENSLANISKWLVVHRSQWYILTVTVSALLFTYLSFFVLGITHFLVSAVFSPGAYMAISAHANTIFRQAVRTFPRLGMLFGAFYVLLFVPAYLSKNRLQDENIVAPADNDKALVVAEKLEMSTLDSLIRRWLALQEIIVALTVIILPLRSIITGHSAMRTGFTFLVALLMLTFARGLKKAAALRFTLFESVQNRLIASTKDK